MAKWSSDSSLIPTLPSKTLSKSLFYISFPCNILSMITYSTSSEHHRKPVSSIHSSKSPSPLLEDASSDGLQVVTDVLLPVPDLSISKSNEKFIRELLLSDSQSQYLAFDHYQKAKLQPDFKPESSTLDLLLDYLVKSDRWSSISVLVEDFRTFDVYPSRLQCTRLIRGCFRARKFKLIESFLGVLETKKGKRVASEFGAALRGYNKLHMYASTVLAFDRMRAADIAPNASCYLSAMDASRKLGDADAVLSLFLEFESGNFSSTSLLPQIYLVLCDSLGNSGRAFKALGYLREMIRKGIAASPSHYESLISSFVQIKEVEIAEDLFQEAQERAMVRDPSVFLKLVVMYVEVGMVEKTVEVVVETMMGMGIKVSDCILSAIVNGYVSRRGLRAALGVYEQLKSLNCELGQVTYSSIINVYCRLGLFDKAEAVFSEMLDKGLDRCLVAYSNMISMYGKLGRVSDAMRLLAKMKANKCRPNVWVYNSLIDMHGRLTNLKQIRKLWNEMKRSNIAPDKISYSSMVSAYSRAKEFEECLRLYNEFKGRDGKKMDRVFAGIMVGVFSKSNMIEELMKLLQEVKSEGIEMDARLYKSSLNALRDAALPSYVKWLQENFRIDEEKT